MKRMRLLVFINKAEREVDVFTHVARELSSMAHGLTVKMLDFSEPRLFEKALQFEPTMLLTFPMTSKGLAAIHYALKLATGCHLVTLQGEGIINYKDDSCYEYYAGLDGYGPDLIDLQMMWSQALVRKVGAILLQSGRMNDPARIVSVGYPKLDGYLGGTDVTREGSLAMTDFLGRISGYPREKVMFFATGFSLGEYSVENLIQARDIFSSNSVPQSEIEEAKRAIAGSRAFRGGLIRVIDEVAPLTPDALYVIKSHPVENILYKRKGKNPYQVLKRHPNVLYYDDQMYIKDVLMNSGVVFHFGSTIVVESYLSKVPSVFVSSSLLFPQDSMATNPNFNMHDMGWPSTLRCDIAELSGIIRSHCRDPLRFSFQRDMQEKLEEGFDVTEEHVDGRKLYRSIRRIAAAIMRASCAPALECCLADPDLVRNIRGNFLPTIVHYLGEALARRGRTHGEEAKSLYLGKIRQLRKLLAS